MRTVSGRGEVRATGAQRGELECFREPTEQQVAYAGRLEGTEHLLGTEARHGRSRNPPRPPRARLESEHVQEVVQPLPGRPGEALGDLVVARASAPGRQSPRGLRPPGCLLRRGACHGPLGIPRGGALQASAPVRGAAAVKPPAARSISGSSASGITTGAGVTAGTGPTATIRPSRWTRSSSPLQRTW